jgi:hypothetical protein
MPGHYGKKKKDTKVSKKKVTKMAEGGMKKDKDVPPFIRKILAQPDGENILAEMLGLTKLNPKTGVREPNAKGGLSVKKKKTTMAKGGMKKAKSYGKPGGYMGGGMAHGKKQAKKK